VINTMGMMNHQRFGAIVCVFIENSCVNM